VARSRELSSAAVLLGVVGFCALAGGVLSRTMSHLWIDLVSRSGQIVVSQESLPALGLHLGLKVAVLLGPVLGCVALVAVSSHLAQFGWLFSTEALSPKLSRVSPMEGLRRLLSVRSLLELLKGLIKLAIVAFVAWRTLEGEWGRMLAAGQSSPGDLWDQWIGVTMRLGLRTGLVLVALGILDYLYQRWELERNLRMTKEEVKEEFRQREGDPKVKGRIRQRQREMARRRMMAAVPKADVVITNPEHLAVALHYRSGEMTAPTVVAKGAGFLAQRIREVARAHGVRLVEDKPLAQALYKGVAVGGQIPTSLYKAVAEILAHVYRERNGRRPEGE
jgi:flagellar biosynthetic protein FlhB